MSRLMMGLHIILVLMFFTRQNREESQRISVSEKFFVLADGISLYYFHGIRFWNISIQGKEVEASPLNRCYEMMRFNEDVESFMKLGNKEILNLFCKNATRYFKCVSDVLKEHTGFTVKEMAIVMEGTDSGEYLNSLVKMEQSVEEMCMNGTQIQSGLEMDFPCFERGRMIPVKHCMEQSLLSYLVFTDLQSEEELSEADHECIIRAYQFGCVAATLREECGVEAFNRYKTVIKKTGFFNSGTCSSDLKQTLKTTLLGFDVTESRKNVYRAILDLKRRRK